MISFDYDAPAELFFVLRASRHAGVVVSRWRTMNYRRFASAAAAIRFVMEDVKIDRFTSAVIEVADGRFEKDKIELLYQAGDFPFERKP